VVFPDHEPRPEETLPAAGGTGPAELTAASA
jgi:hypothetical protein